ncbi:MAG: hypothetical protein LIP01_02695 [Tannerellaceae bacterium]|nr:hypothetical protein [Tannerellaceae bacterium]
MKKILFICLTVLMVVGVSSCGSRKDAIKLSYNDLNGEWDVIEMNSKVLDPQQTGQVFCL